MSNQYHIRAKEAVRNNLLPGRTLEIVTKLPWGFSLENSDTIRVDAFLQSVPTFYTNIILHIVHGETQSAELFADVYKKAAGLTSRLLILEHHKSIHGGLIGDLIYMSHKVVDIDERNILFVMTPIFNCNNNYCDVNASNVNELIDTRWRFYPKYPGSEKIFTLTSELNKETNRILPKDIVSRLPKDRDFYCVAGGFVFLQVLSEIDCNKFFIFDSVLPQTLYAAYVINMIMGSVFLEDFDAQFNNEDIHFGIPKIAELGRKRIYHFWPTNYLKTLSNTPNYTPNWRNVLRLGSWRQRYREVREKLCNTEIKILWETCSKLRLKKSDILYAGTILPREFEVHEIDYLIEAYTDRNVPTLRK